MERLWLRGSAVRLLREANVRERAGKGDRMGGGEGTGTWPNYLVNRDDQKNEGPFGEKNCTEIEK